jgi:sugar (pentulose or hexulose) kinase
MPLVAGVDSSTTATKVEVRDLDTGRVVGRRSFGSVMVSRRIRAATSSY